MEIGAFFILAVVLVVLAVGGTLLLGTGAALRRKQLHPDENKLSPQPDRERQPEHAEVENEQRARFVGTR